MRLLLAASTILLASACVSISETETLAPARSASAAMPLPEITIFHLEGRRSERIVWLMEELGLPYKLEFKRGDLAGSMASIRAINPGMPVAPTVKIGDQVVVESGAIIETILDRYAPGRLTPQLASADYPEHLKWMHYAEGSLASRVIADYRVWQIRPPTARSPLVDSAAVVQYAADYLGRHPWFGGAEFTAADIMMFFPLNFATALNIVDKNQFPNIAAWRTKIEARPAFQRMRAKALPDGMVGNLPALPQHAPAGPRTPAPAAN
ncbi:MAG: glutathione S-transferase [Alphaproteobacteria bacterium]|nr:glutathione S-transferase [Alphaproteobacteria bacterium]